MGRERAYDWRVLGRRHDGWLEFVSTLECSYDFNQDFARCLTPFISNRLAFTWLLTFSAHPQAQDHG